MRNRSNLLKSAGRTADGQGVRLAALLIAVAIGAPVAASVVTASPVAAASSAPVVGVAPAAGTGHWTVDRVGVVRAGGRAPALGSTGRPPARPVVAIASTPGHDGYWLATSGGGIFPFGTARFLGSAGTLRLNRPIVGMAPTPTGNGYWLVASDGGIFTFGDARYLGSTGNVRLARPIVGIGAHATGRGYWLFAADGGVFSFGDAPFRGRVTTAVVAATNDARAAAARGYLLVDASGVVTRRDATTPVAPLAPAPVAAGEREAWRWPFTSTSPWNMPIGSGAVYAGTGDARVAALTSDAYTPWVNAGNYSHPIVTASAADPLTTLTSPGQAPLALRIPAAAVPAGGSDAHLHIVDPSRRWLDETWSTTRTGSGYASRYHIRTDLTGPGVGQRGVRAYGGSAIGGLIRTWELDAGVIRHALAIALGNGQLRRGWVWPATTEDGDAASSYRGAVPMGSLLAVPPDVNVADLGLSREGTMVAKALQDYGAYVVDRATGPILYAEPSAEGTAGLKRLRGDMRALRDRLRVVTNNGPASVGGGGVPRVPGAPPLATPG